MHGLRLRKARVALLYKGNEIHGYSSICSARGSRTSCVSTPIARTKNGRISLISIELRFGNYHTRQCAALRDGMANVH